MDIPRVYLTFHNELQMLLPKSQAERRVKYLLKRRASLKDIVESLGVPHTEVARVLLSNSELGFGFIPVGGEDIDILGFSEENSAYAPTLLRPRLFAGLKFMVDINVQKLARNLRLIGFDTSLVPDLPLLEIGSMATGQQRILLTRNRELLKCGTVIHGHLVRSENHPIQLRETVQLYKLKSHIKAFSRCVVCNGVLIPVAKEQINHRLEPLTRKYYLSFKRCVDCEKIYWQGSHHDRMLQLIGESC